MADIEVTVETPSENQIVEVTYDGQEIVQPPLTQSEHLSRQAAKIDFGDHSDNEDDEDDDDDDDDDEDEDDEEEGEGNEEESGENEAELETTDDSKWPWESVRDRLRNALAEVSVLSDVITIATKECGRDGQGNPKRYMVLDGPTTFEQPEQKPYVSLLAKKGALDAHVAKILLSGADHLRSLQNENRTTGGEEKKKSNFHFELLRLRQHWRLKKVSNTILGDLSFRTAGSQFKQSGIFEVVKADTTNNTNEDVAEDENDVEKIRSCLKVNVPSELEGIAFIQVVIQKESEQLVSANLTHGGVFGGSSGGGMMGGPSYSGDVSNTEDVHWTKKLEQAQNVIFCKELFAQLAKEAIQLQAPVPHMVVGNQISCCLFSDIQLLITLWYKTGAEKKSHMDILLSKEKEKKSQSSESEEGIQQQPPVSGQSAPQPAKEHSHVLEHSLHQLLRKAHARNINSDHSGLSSSPVGVSKRRRLAGPRASDRKSLLKMANEETFLEQIILQAQHVVLRLGTMYVLDTWAAGLKDPLITFHWSTLSSPTRTSVKVSIVTAGYDSILRTQLVIHVYAKTLTFVCKDGRVLHFSHEPQELRDFILCQISQHQINGVQALAKCTGWQVLSSSTYHLGCGSVEPLGNATGCLLSNASGDRFIAVRHSPQSVQTSVFIAKAPCTNFFPGSVVKDRKWENLPDSFQEVRLDKMEGKNLLNKLELLMAALSTPNNN